VLAALLPLLMGAELLQSPNRAVEDGNSRFKTGKADEALAEYDKAAKRMPGEPGVHFNRGAALYALKRFEEAKEAFLRATEAKATPLKEKAFYNLGNSFFGLEKYDDAIAAYRRALALDPGDVSAKWNLELALKKRRQQQDQQKNQDQKNDQKNDQQKKDEQQKQDPQKQSDEQKPGGDDKQQQPDQQPPEDQQKKPEEQRPEPGNKGEQPKDQQPPPPQKDEPAQGKAGQPPPPEKGADMREIDAVLDSLERSPKELEKMRARLRAIRRAPPAKDW
jgi:Ca-activated chloride channel family protein